MVNLPPTNRGVEMKKPLAVFAFSLILIFSVFLSAQEGTGNVVKAPPAVSVAVAKPAGLPTWAKHNFTFNDMIMAERLSDLDVSKDGKWAAYGSTRPNLKKNKSQKDIWLISTDGSIKKQLTSHESMDFSPQWTPDGRVAFLSDRSGAVQIWTIDPNGGEAVQLTNLPIDVESFRISPDGSQIAFAADVYPECDTLQCTVDKDKAASDSGVKAHLYKKLMVRHWDKWEDDKYQHIFVVPFGGGAEPKDMMKGMLVDSPSKPFGGIEEYAWSPDGRELAITAMTDPNPAWSTNYDVYLVNVASGEKKNLTALNPAWDGYPLYSPDGKYLLYKAMKRPGFESDKFNLVIVDRTTNEQKVPTENWSLNPVEVKWSQDGTRLFALADSNAERPIFAIDLATNEIKEIVANNYDTFINVTQDRLVFLQDNFNSPAEVWTANLDGTDVKQISSVNTALVNSIEWGEVKKFTFKGANDEDVQGWIILPPKINPQKKYPVAMIVHGGPQNAISNHFHYRWNSQIFAGAGHIVIAVNFHGSPGWGQDFTDAISGHWGDIPLDDLIKGLDFAIQNNPVIDEARICALGASYGGYMINWINGKTDRFKCLVNHSGIFDNTTMYYETDELFFDEWEFGGTPYDVPMNYSQFSPMTLVQNWKTPTLIIHGGNDFRVPETNAIATFNALQRRGIKSEFLYFPDETHFVAKPKNSELWHKTVLEWLGQHIGTSPK